MEYYFIFMVSLKIIAIQYVNTRTITAVNIVVLVSPRDVSEFQIQVYIKYKL